MPEGEPYWNPYRMVPVKERIERSAPVTDEAFKGKSGVIHCSLKTLTSVCVASRQAFGLVKFVYRDNRATIPGSSLKGMLRSLAEIVGGGCFVTPSAKGSSAPLPDSYRACNRNKDLCITCRMFGMMGRGSNATVHKGKISISDGSIRENNIRFNVFEIMQMSHGTRHDPFYVSPDSGHFDGLCRKVYFHQPQRRDSVPEIPADIRRMAADHIRSIEAIPPGNHFDFEVDFINLTQDEFELLVYVLALEGRVEVEIGGGGVRLSGPLRHKIGLGKPLGLGSCHIAINRLVIRSDAKSRFSSLNSGQGDVYEDDVLTAKIQELTKGFIEDKSPTMTQLRKMMVWDENDPRQFTYPSYYWFKTPGNSGKHLKKI